MGSRQEVSVPGDDMWRAVGDQLCSVNEGTRRTTGVAENDR
jgi:hypothetical protein